MSDNITLTITGLSALLGSVDGWGKEVEAQAQAKLGDAGQMMYDGADMDTPVLTGYLKSRNQLDVQPNLATLTNDADYALFVELGTSKMAAQPFIVPNWTAAAQWLQDELKNL